MKTIQTILTLTALLLTAGAARSEITALIAGSDVADKYVGLNSGLLTGDPVAQSFTKAVFGNGAYAKVCLSRSLKGRWNDGSLGNEADYALGWSGSVSGRSSLDVSATYWDEPRAGTFGKGDILYLKAVGTRSFKNFSLTTSYEQFVPMPGSGFRGGVLAGFGGSVGRSFGDKWNARASAFALYDTGVFGNKTGLLLRGTIGLDRTLTRRLTLNLVAVNWYAPIALKAGDKRVARSMAYTGVTWSWAK